MKKTMIFMMGMVGIMVCALAASAGIEQSKVIPVPYGYADPSCGTGCGTTPGYPQYPQYPQHPQYPQYPQHPQYPQYPNPNYNYNYGCGAAMNPQQYEYCTKWIPGHWVRIQMIVPGHWEYRPVWIPAYPVSRNQWVVGYWQTTASTNTRPDVYVWNSPQGEWYGMPVQSYHGTQGGYFTPNGVWIPPTNSASQPKKTASQPVEK